MRGILLAMLLCPAAFAEDGGHQHKHPDLAVRIDQALLESPGVLDAENQALKGKIKDLEIALKEDGLHIKGKYPIPVLPAVSFEAVVSFVWTGPDRFDIKLHKVKILLFNITKLVLNVVKTRLAEALKGVCAFQDGGENDDGSRTLHATVDMRALTPTLPELHLSDIATRDKLLILKAKMP